ncbi:MAG: HAD hydrolase-like protein, partial [Longispora sp.]|nr:HAD hydrolase-like protein [Longispora sp. (in: high G+C Gram-positive bacteria)]
MTTRVRAVLLDLDGTLLDHKGAAQAAFLTACVQWLPDLDEQERQEAHAEWQRLEAIHMRAYLNKAVTFQEQRRTRLRGVLSAYGQDAMAVSDAKADELFTIYSRHYEKAWTAYDDVPEAMDFLGTAPAGVAVLSNGDRLQQEAKLASIGLTLKLPLFTPSDVG